MCRCLPLDCGGLAPALLTDSGVSGTPDPVGLAPTELLAEATCAGPVIDNRGHRKHNGHKRSLPVINRPVSPAGISASNESSSIRETSRQANQLFLSFLLRDLRTQDWGFLSPVNSHYHSYSYDVSLVLRLQKGS